MTHLSNLERRVATDVFKTDVMRWASRIGVEPKAIHVRRMKRKWASCSSNGRLTFAEHLLTESAAFRDQVIVHELLHLRVPNHGRLFRSLLRAYLDPRLVAAGGGGPQPHANSVRAERPLG